MILRSNKINNLSVSKIDLPTTESCHVFRDHLTPTEITCLLKAVKRSRNSDRDYALVLMMYRHGLRRSEAAGLRWADIDLKGATIYVRRKKGSRSGRHPLYGNEIRALRKIQSDSPYVFLSERGSPISVRRISALVREAGKRAEFDFEVNSHLLRHSCGYYLANNGLDTRLIQDYLGHANIQNTVRYTQLSAKRFEGLWD